MSPAPFCNESRHFLCAAVPSTSPSTLQGPRVHQVLQIALSKHTPRRAVRHWGSLTKTDAAAVLSDRNQGWKVCAAPRSAAGTREGHWAGNRLEVNSLDSINYKKGKRFWSRLHLDPVLINGSAGLLQVHWGSLWMNLQKQHQTKTSLWQKLCP